MRKRQYLRKDTFDSAEIILPNQTEEVYVFLHHFGQRLPEKFGVDDVVDEICYIWNLVSYFPNKLNKLDATFVAKNIVKIVEVFEKVSDESDMTYLERKISRIV